MLAVAFFIVSRFHPTVSTTEQHTSRRCRSKWRCRWNQKRQWAKSKDRVRTITRMERHQWRHDKATNEDACRVRRTVIEGCRPATWYLQLRNGACRKWRHIISPNWIVDYESLIIQRAAQWAEAMRSINFPYWLRQSILQNIIGQWNDRMIFCCCNAITTPFFQFRLNYPLQFIRF